MRDALLLFAVGMCLSNVALSLKICAFNIQSFGEAKANNKKVMGILLQILSRCDLCLVQEVRDSKGEAIQTLVKDLNSFDESNSYSYVESERLGRKTYKEQYVYIYKDNVLKVREHYQYSKLEGEANDTDIFSREPFIVRFHSPTTWDLSAGCSYVTIKGWKAVRLRSDPKFRWLIGDEQDTTVRQKTHCAYDSLQKMEQSFADLLSGAFSETSLPSFRDGDLDFVNLSFDEKFEEDKTGSSHKNIPIPTKEDEVLHQEATGQNTVLCSLESVTVAENDDEQRFDDKNNEEDFLSTGVSVMIKDKTSEEDHKSSDGDPEEEGFVSDDEDEEEDMRRGDKPGDWLMSVHCSEDVWDGNKEDKIFTEGQPLALQGQARNEVQVESESDEELSYFGRFLKGGSEMMIKAEGNEDGDQQREEERQGDSTDSECEDMNIEKNEEEGENLLAQNFTQEDEGLDRDKPVKSTFEFPELSMQNLQDLIAEVNSEKYDKMKDFSGEEHQEAGESFADYPSDLSSCEYMEDGGKDQESDGQKSVENPEEEEEEEEEEADGAESRETNTDKKIMGWDFETEETDNRGKPEMVEHILGSAVAKGCDEEKDDINSYSSSDDEIQMRRSDEEEFSDNMCFQNTDSSMQLDDPQHFRGSRAAFSEWSISDDLNNRNNEIRVDSAAFSIFWGTDVLKTEDFSSDVFNKEAGTSPADVAQGSEMCTNSYSVIHHEDVKTTRASAQGSVDNSFFFNTELESSGINELGQLGDDEYEEERNWELEQERIEAFYKFYNDSDGENGREERKIKVQFCTDPLSQVIQYDTDSSDRESLNSSTDGEEDLSAAETSEELRQPESLKSSSALDSPKMQLSEDVLDLCNTQLCTRKHKCVAVLKLILKMLLVILMGLLIFCLATDQLDWFSHVSSF
ncbi:hypothetical protein LDENG_00020850 [Lucifuga dentata]|nr:hypothetical protein LDENG_00020850 [Lucifuga dentata]